MAFPMLDDPVPGRHRCTHPGKASIILFSYERNKRWSHLKLIVMFANWDKKLFMGKRIEMFSWPEAEVVIPSQKWIRNAGLYPQHRFWSSEDYWLSCLQDYNADDYDEVTSIAEVFGVSNQLADFKANVTDPYVVEIFRGYEDDSQPVRFVFLCTINEVLLVEMEFYSGWNAEAQSNLEAYVRACEIELRRRCHRL